MIRAAATSAVIALLTFAAPAHAAEQDYDCDTAAEHFSELKQTLSGSSYEASGTITARQMYVGDRYITAARVSLQSADDRNFLSFRLYGSAKASDKTLMATLFVRIDGKDSETPLGPVDLMKPLAFSLHVDPNGSARLSLGEWQRDLKIPLGSVAIASATCSTGEFQFSHLKLGG